MNKGNEFKREYLGKKFIFDNEIFIAYAVTHNGVFAHKEGDNDIDEKGNYVNPKYFEYSYIDENPVPVGRPSIGVTKKVSLTLPEALWNEIEKIKTNEKISQSELLRTIIEIHFNKEKENHELTNQPKHENEIHL